jgi:hypothetical protein
MSSGGTGLNDYICSIPLISNFQHQIIVMPFFVSYTCYICTGSCALYGLNP